MLRTIYPSLAKKLPGELQKPKSGSTQGGLDGPDQDHLSGLDGALRAFEGFLEALGGLDRPLFGLTVSSVGQWSFKGLRGSSVGIPWNVLLGFEALLRHLSSTSKALLKDL